MTLSAVLGILCVVAYLIGGVPFGLLVGKLRGVVVRDAGSGNIGATNVGRLLGTPFFYLTLVLDAFKGFVPMSIASLAVLTQTDPGERGPVLYGLWVLVGVAAVLGHVFSVFLGFRGGKGIATGLGMLLGFFPYGTLPVLVAVGVFVATVKLTRYVSLGSIFSTAAVLVAYLVLANVRDWDWTGRQWPIGASYAGLLLLVIWRHLGNLRRLARGEESKVGATRDNST